MESRFGSNSMMEFEAKIPKKIWAALLYTVGQPKFLEDFGVKLHHWVWPKTWLHTNFWVPTTSLYHNTRASKQAILSQYKLENCLFWSSRVVVKRCCRDPKIGMQSRFGSNSMVEFDSKIPKNFGCPSVHVFCYFIHHEWIKLDGWNPALQVQRGNSQVQKQLEQQWNR